MTRAIRLVLAVFATYRLASMVSKDEGPYFPFLYKDDQQTGLFEWLRIRLGVYDYGPQGTPTTNIGRGLSCPLCTGVYISAAMGLLSLRPTLVGDLLLTWMGVSGAQVFLENLTSDDALEGGIEDVADSLEDK